ncbi:hypothetical protein [Legionella spiritensis]|uniref:Membrane protein n=1 Tax=Legionella spiritensis TaxID=452 RepID=A0A0W0YWD5_LEGSP|nr:hypothetical protein [Legionella spiritensis]KTD61213.1 membrane protein [Legionella spiritensis]SNV28191.1 membrane protein [Legionella spiritensis]
MKISRSVLNKAVDARIINARQADQLLDFLHEQDELAPEFNLTNVLYYFGGLIAIGAMTLFMNLGWETFGGWGLFYLSILYGILGLSLTSVFHKKQLKTPAGICATFVVCLTPLAIYGLQLAMGWWPDSSVYRDYHAYIKWHWIFMELGTLAVGIILAWIYRYPFMLMPVAVTLWYMSMDIAAMLGQHSQYSFELRAMVSMYFGLAMIFLAFWVDIRSRNALDYAFWLYIFGVLAFWGGLSSQSSDSELSRFFYLCINLVMIGIGVLLVRKVFVIFGALGCACYLGHLAWQVFAHSTFFPVALTIIGAFLIYLGTLWQKHEKALTLRAQSYLPKPVQELLQARNEE